MLTRLLIELVRLKIGVVVLSIAAISSAVSMRIGSMIVLDLSSNAAKTIQNLVCQMSA